MPPCHCIPHSCGGRDVSPLTLRQHKKDTNAYLSAKFQQAGVAAVQAYEEKLGQDLFEHTLCNTSPPGRSRLWGKPSDTDPINSALEDNARSPPRLIPPVSVCVASSFNVNSPPPQVASSPETGFWRALSSSNHSSVPSSNSPSAHTERVRLTLDKLTALESQVNHISHALSSIRESAGSDPQCLAPLYSQAEEISKQIQVISIKAQAVVAVRDEVEAKLKVVADELDVLHDKLATKPPDPPDEYSYDTSKFICVILQQTST
jgi:hypothetical protein